MHYISVYPSLSPARTHACPPARPPARTHARTHAHTHTHSLTYTHCFWFESNTVQFSFCCTSLVLQWRTAITFVEKPDFLRDAWLSHKPELLFWASFVSILNTSYKHFTGSSVWRFSPLDGGRGAGVGAGGDDGWEGVLIKRSSCTRQCSWDIKSESKGNGSQKRRTFRQQLPSVS